MLFKERSISFMTLLLLIKNEIIKKYEICSISFFT